jgi:hypothetical protein
MAHAIALPKSFKKSIAMACIAGQTHGAAGYPRPGAWQTSNAGGGLSHILRFSASVLDFSRLGGAQVTSNPRA